MQPSTKLAFGLLAFIGQITNQTTYAWVEGYDFKFDHVPTLAEIQVANDSHNDSDRYVFNLKDPFKGELEQFSKLTHLKGAVFEIGAIPTSHTLEAWKKIIPSRIDLKIRGFGIPASNEIRRLNSLEFAHLSYGVPEYPRFHDVDKLNAFKEGTIIHFETGRFPKEDEMSELERLAAHLVLSFDVDTWPRSIQVGFLNSLPQKKIIMIRGVFPTALALEDLYQIQDLQEVSVDSSFDPYPVGYWDFKSTPLTWIRRDGFPRADVFSAFGEFGSRTLIIEGLDGLNSEQRRLLYESPVPARIHRTF